MTRKYNRKDQFYKQAKDEGYRSRAAYKLKELQKRYKVIKKGDSILDLGCFPGGWLQVASEITGPKGVVLGVDITPLEELSSESGKILVEKADLYEHEDISKRIEAHGLSLFDVVISDMSPKLTGIVDRDQARCSELFELAFEYCQRRLKPGGNFVAKVFPGQDTERIFRENKTKWKSLLKKSLSTSRTSSQELYVIGLGFRNKS